MTKEEFYQLSTNKRQEVILELRKTKTLDYIANMFDYSVERIRLIQNRNPSPWDCVDNKLSERTKRALDRNGIHSIEELKKRKIGELLLMKGIGKGAIKEIKELQ